MNFYSNIIEFYCDHILLSDLIKNMKLSYSMPFLFIFNIDRMSLQSYVNSFSTKSNSINLSEWADYIEQDFKNLDMFIYSLIFSENKDFCFKFDFTGSLALVIKTVFLFSKYLSQYSDIVKKDIDEHTIENYKKIMKSITDKWTDINYRYFHLFFPYDIKNEIYAMIY